MKVEAQILIPFSAGCCPNANPNSIVAAQEKIAAETNACRTPWWFWLGLGGVAAIVGLKKGGR